MGRRGPPPKPTNLRVLEGNPSKRPLPDNEPKPKPKAPECPEWMDDIAKSEWTRIAPKLERLGLLTEIDGTALAGYCQAYSQWRQADEFLQKHGTTFVIRDEDGKPKYLQQVPQVSIAQKNLQIVKSFCQEFGMTPSARSRIEIKGDDDEDDMDRLLSG